jgi:hypothetical protein
MKLKNSEITILQALSTTPSTFSGFLSAYPDRPDDGDQVAKDDLRHQLHWLRDRGLVTIAKDAHGLDQLSLTQKGQQARIVGSI